MMLNKSAAWVQWWGGDFYPVADQVHEQERIVESKLLGPDGKPLKYERPPFGFDLRKRDA